MNALVILYDGSKVQSHVLDQMIAQMANDPERKVAEVYPFSDDDLANAIVAHVLPSCECVRDENADQVAINHAVEYITKTVLVRSTNPTKVGYMIGAAISSGDNKMYNAVEIIATKHGVINEPKFTKSIVSAIKQIYEFECA